MLRAKLEEVAEVIRLIDELGPFEDKMIEQEKTIVNAVNARILMYGESAYISDVEVRFIRQAYTRILDSAL